MSPAEPGHPDAADHGRIPVKALVDQQFPTVVVELFHTSLLSVLARALVDARLLPEMAVLGTMGASEFGTHALANLRHNNLVLDALTLTLTPADAYALGQQLIGRAYLVDSDVDDADDLREAR